MKIKNQLILALINNGLPQITHHEVHVKDAYKVFRFKNRIEKAAEELDERRISLIKEIGIEDGNEFYARKLELEAIAKLTEEEAKELEEINNKDSKFQKMWQEFLGDETEVGELKLISFDSFHILAKENKQIPILVPDGKDKANKPKFTTITVDFFSRFIGDLEGILWKAPEEDAEEDQ